MPGPEYLDALILGVVQGIAEFLPISSSGHVVIVNELLAEVSGRTVPRGNFELNAALHVGTLLSILVVYRHDLRRLLSRQRLCWAIVIATLPLVVIGSLPGLRRGIETIFEAPLVAGFGLLATAVALAVGQSTERARWSLDNLPGGGALMVGLCQAAALIPGVSRSGSTIAGGLLAGLDRREATTFSFLIAVPAIFGVGVLLGERMWSSPSATATPAGILALAAAIAFVVGVVALKWLLRLVSQRRLHWFAWYCAALGAATVVWQLRAG